jgi:hypothetical protein
MEKFLKLLGFLAGCLFFGMLWAFPTMWLLNWLVPVLIPGAAGWTITWLQAWGVNILCNILFKENDGDDSGWWD